MMWLVLGSVSSDFVIVILLSGADNSVNAVEQKLFALLKVCNFILIINIAVMIAVFYWIQFLYLLTYVLDLTLVKYLYSLLIS